MKDVIKLSKEMKEIYFDERKWQHAFIIIRNGGVEIDTIYFDYVEGHFSEACKLAIKDLIIEDEDELIFYKDEDYE